MAARTPPPVDTNDGVAGAAAPARYKTPDGAATTTPAAFTPTAADESTFTASAAARRYRRERAALARPLLDRFYRINLAEAYMMRLADFQPTECTAAPSAEQATYIVRHLMNLSVFSRLRTRLVTFVDGAPIDGETRSQLATFVHPVTANSYTEQEAYATDHANATRQAEVDVAVATSQVQRDDPMLGSPASATVTERAAEWAASVWAWRPKIDDSGAHIPLACAVALVHAAHLSGFNWFRNDDWARVLSILYHNIKRADIAPSLDDLSHSGGEDDDAIAFAIQEDRSHFDTSLLSIDEAVAEMNGLARDVRTPSHAPPT